VTKRLIEEYAGPTYQANSEGNIQYINLLGQTVEAYQMILASNRPKVKLTTKFPKLKPFGKHFETALNNLFEEIKLEETISDWVLDAFFCVGILKTHMADSGRVVVEQDVAMDPGIPFASNISIDNWVHDTSATKITQAKFFGDMYRIPYEDFIESGFYDKEVIERFDIRPNSKLVFDGERLEDISRGNETDPDELEPMIDLIDLYVPRDTKIYTYAVSNRKDMILQGEPVSEMEWRGSEFGPYKFLSFNDVPENIMPASPADQLSSLSQLINSLMRKQANKAARQKDVHGYDPASAESAENLKNAGDGDWVKITNAKEVQTIQTGGADQGIQMFMLNGMELFNRSAGNLDQMLGLGPSADTASQEKLIATAASKKETAMQNRVLKGVKSVATDLGLMLWEDKFKIIPSTLAIPGAEGIEVDSTWLPDFREGNFLDYNFDIDVYSMLYKTPSDRITSITQVVTQVFLPMYQMMAQQGGSIDMMMLSELYSELLDEPRIKEVLKFQNAPQLSEQPMTDLKTPKPPTTRNYVRRNISSNSGGMSGTAKPGNWAQMSQPQQNPNA